MNPPTERGLAYGARATTGRATKAAMTRRHEALAKIVLEDGPMSVRHAYYRAVVAGVVPKDETGYRKVQRAVLAMRRDGTIGYDLIVDNTRWMRKPTTWSSLDDMLADAARYYRRALWADADVLLEVWCESDSIAGTIVEITDRWDVPLMVCRGFASETFAYNAAAAWTDDPDRAPVVLYIGDLDPAGIEIERNLRAKLDDFYIELAPFGDRDIEWTKLGITIEQVEDLGLQNTGTKPKKSFHLPLAWEVEALPAPYLRALVEAEIESYIEEAALEATKAAEASEREVLHDIARTKGGGSA